MIAYLKASHFIAIGRFRPSTLSGSHRHLNDDNLAIPRDICLLSVLLVVIDDIALHNLVAAIISSIYRRPFLCIEGRPLPSQRLVYAC